MFIRLCFYLLFFLHFFQEFKNCIDKGPIQPLPIDRSQSYLLENTAASQDSQPWANMHGKSHKMTEKNTSLTYCEIILWGNV